MHGAIEQAKVYLKKMLVAFPLDRLHVSVFNTHGREVKIPAASAKAVDQAFRGYAAGGGTYHEAGVMALAHHAPKETEDTLIFFVGDQGQREGPGLANVIQGSGINPVAIGMLNVGGGYWGIGNIVNNAAARLGIPLFPIDEGIFSDPYATSRNLRNLIASTPIGKKVGATPRVTLVEQILKTSLLRKPVWA